MMQIEDIGVNDALFLRTGLKKLIKKKLEACSFSIMSCLKEYSSSVEQSLI